MAFMVKDGFRLYYEDTGGTAPTRAVPARRRWQSPELVAAGAGVRRGVPVRHGRPAWLRPVAGRRRRAGASRARHGRARVARSPGDRAGRAWSRSRWAAGRPWVLRCGRRSVSGRSSWRTRSATSPIPTSPPRARSWPPRAHRGRPCCGTRRWGRPSARRSRSAAFLYAQIAGVNAPRPADFSDQLGRLTTPVERYAATRVPTLFLTSDEDGLIWPELSQKVHEHVPGSRFERVEAAGHSTYFERPDVFNREVGAFLKGHRP